MRVPLSWLKNYITITLEVNELANTLTMAGLEVDKCESIELQAKGIIVAKVVECWKHPEADKLSIARVFDGKETYEVVCGASNCRVGIKVAFAPIGTVFKSKEGEFTIKKAKLRGVESSGMLCSAKELGLSDDADGIIELPLDLKEGLSLEEIYSDTIFEISLTPNLNHCASMMGVARELSAVTGLSLNHPQVTVNESNEDIVDFLHVEVLAKDECPRYACRVIKNVTVAPSPAWLKERLEACGLRSVNNIVDATNYVLLEMGQPLHAFDYDRIDDHRIIIRKALEGDLLGTLDGKSRILKENMLLICDSHKPLAVAGIMGGLESEISSETRIIVLESAYFNSTNIRRTSKRLGLSTDASKRFERGSDPNQVLISLNRAAQLIQQIAGGEVLKGVIDLKAQEFLSKNISCRLSRINQILGILFSRGEVETIFRNLNFPYEWDGHDKFTVNVPTYRVDISAEIDLIEEVARLYGYDNIPRVGGRFESSTLPANPVYLFESIVRSSFISQGLQEFLTCDLIGPSMIQVVQDDSTLSKMMISVLNPTSIEQSILRTSLLPGLLQVIKHNYDHQSHDVAGFEIGRIHFKEADNYIEQSVAAIILTGKSRPHHWGQKPEDYDFYDLKGIIENFLNEIGIFGAEFRNLGLGTFHSGRQASIFIQSLEVGSFGELHPAIQRRLDIPQRVLFGEFNLQDLMKLIQPVQKIKSLALYPQSERDWTCTIDENISFDSILSLIEKNRPYLLESVSLKDVYRSDKLPLGYQNLTFNFVYRDLSKTIELDTIEAMHNQLISGVVEQLINVIKN